MCKRSMDAMRQRHLAPLAATLLVAVGAPRPAVAQSQPDAIPVSLVSALLDDRMGMLSTAHEYAVGRLPRGYPPRLVPAGSVQIVGGMSSRDETIAVFADSTRRLAAVFEQLFEQAGYTHPPQTPGSGFSAPVGPYSYFCSDSGTVSVEPLSGLSRTFARVTYRPARDRSSCRATERVIPPHELKLPPLTPPPGTEVQRAGGSAGTSQVESSAEVSGANLVPSAIVAYYSAQLVAAGWTAETPAISERVAAQYLVAKDSSGATWEGVLMASGSRGKVDVVLAMNPREGR